MKHFDVYLHAMLGIEAVKTGFSWTGCFFTWIWMLICRLWGRGIAVCVIAASTPFAAGVVGKLLFAGERLPRGLEQGVLHGRLAHGADDRHRGDASPLPAERIDHERTGNRR